jgi:hypothetical protein
MLQKNVCRSPEDRIIPVEQVRIHAKLKHSLLSPRFGMARIHKDADRTVPLFSVFLGGAVFFLTFY